MKNMLIAAATGLMLVATPALAAGPEPEAAVAKPAVDRQTARPTTKATRYCVIQPPVTGSQIARKICNTLEGWRAEGFDPLAK